MRIVCKNGILCDETQARVSVFDRSVLLGDGFFETVRVYAGRPFRLASHLKRLRSALELWGLSLATYDFERDVRTVVAAGGSASGALRVLVLGGAGPGGLGGEVAYEVYVLMSDWQPPSAEYYLKGVSAVRSPMPRPELATVAIKSTSYSWGLWAMRQARVQGADEALLGDGDGYLAEATAANVLVHFHGRGWVTPPVGPRVRDGVTREVAMELLKSRGHRVQEEPIKLEELRQASAMILTASLREIVPITRLDGVDVGSGVVMGEVVQLMQDYRAETEKS